MSRLRTGFTLLASLFAAQVAVATAAELPAVPKDITDKGKLTAGVRCDQPPYGYKDAKGGFAGIEVEIAKQIATWAFGSEDKANLVCVTAESRIPQLMGNKVDMLVATLGVTPERARVVAFSDPYRWDSSDVVVKADSPIKSLKDLEGKNVIALKGSTQARWLGEHMSNIPLTNLNSSSEALMAFKQGRAEGYAHDSATLVMISARDKNVRRLNEPYGVSFAAIGLRKGEDDWLAYVNAALAKMKEDGLYSGWIEASAPEGTVEFYRDGFEKPAPADHM